MLNNIEVFYKVSYFDAIKDYSDNWSNAVYKTEYKDVDHIQQYDPVFSCLSTTAEQSKVNTEKSVHLAKETPKIDVIHEDLEISDIEAEAKIVKDPPKPLEIEAEDHTVCNDAPQVNLEFDGNFEGGNLHSAIKITDNEYHLFIHPDTNTGGHTQWFYFKVKNMLQNKIYTFKIMNFNKKQSAFQKGMTPCVFSTNYWKAENNGWVYTETFNVNYCQNPFNQTVNNSLKDKYADKYGPVGKNGKKLKSSHDASHNPRAKKLYALTFSYKGRYSDDTVFFSFATPYSYSQLNQFLDKLMIEAEKLNKSSNVEVTKLELGKTLGGRSVTIMKISSKSNKNKKKGIVITARCHPGETVGSFVMEGVLKTLIK